MIIILNGSVGTGKSSTMEALTAGFEQAVALDGDAIGDVQPFEIYDEERISYLYKTIEHLVRFHMNHGYRNFVINYVFETPDQLARLSSSLQALGQEVHAFWLYCRDECQTARIRKRGTNQIDWELERFPVLNRILEQAHESGFIGTPLDNSNLTAKETAGEIRARIDKQKISPEKNSSETALIPELAEVPGISTRLQQQLGFIYEIDRIKQIFRKTRLFDDSRFENDAEHSWTICCMAVLLKEYSNEDIDLGTVLKMLLVHDIVEIDAGDTFLYDVNREQAHIKEQAAAERIFGLLEADQRDELLALWEEFENRSSPEARFAAVLDRLEPLLQNFHTHGESWQKYGIRPDMVLARNAHIQEGSEELWQLAHALIEESQRRGYFSCMK
ncbi:HD domain-containing protein [Spirochaeta dissipatitropha]